MVPGSCEVLVDRRMIPGETVESVVGHLRGALADEDLEVTVAEEEGVYEPAEIAADGPAVAALSLAMEAFGLDVDLFGTPYSSDVRHLINAAGVEAMTFGPGRYTEMHARDEFIRINDLVRAARPLAAFCATIHR